MDQKIPMLVCVEIVNYLVLCSTLLYVQNSMPLNTVEILLSL